jgi:hypothetical protein
VKKSASQLTKAISFCYFRKTREKEKKKKVSLNVYFFSHLKVTLTIRKKRFSMNLNSGFFPPYGYRRKHTSAAYHLSLNNQQHHHASSLQSARSSTESASGNELFLPSISTAISNNDSHKPYRQNDFANNHLFIAKRKLARVFLGQPTRNLQATSDLIHLFDPQESKRKHRNINKSKHQVNLYSYKNLFLKFRILLGKCL